MGREIFRAGNIPGKYVRRGKCPTFVDHSTLCLSAYLRLLLTYLFTYNRTRLARELVSHVCPRLYAVYCNLYAQSRGRLQHLSVRAANLS